VNVRLGSDLEVVPSLREVRFTSDNRHVADYRAPHSRIARVTGFVSDIFHKRGNGLWFVRTTGSAGEGHHPTLDGWGGS
jgi:hypothetical protein